MNKEYTVSARSARPVGSIGLPRPMRVYVMAESKEDALIKAYEQIEHIHKPVITEGHDVEVLEREGKCYALSPYQGDMSGYRRQERLWKRKHKR